MYGEIEGAILKRALQIVGLATVLTLLVPLAVVPKSWAQETHVTREGGAWGQEITGSLAADALLVVIGQAVFPSTRGYPHFQFSDYAKLTVIGVIIACVAWPIVTRITSAPQWMFFRMAVLVTLVLWLPDLYILHGGAAVQAVAVLMVTHLAIALVTYNVLMRLAPVGPAVPASREPHHARQ